MATLTGSNPINLPEVSSALGIGRWTSWSGSAPLPLGGVPSFNLPQITNISPAVGETLASKTSPITFDVTDIDSELASVAIWTKIDSFIVGEYTILVYDGTQFVWPFEQSSAVSVIDDGFHFSVVYNGSGGWPGNISGFVARAVSSHGEVAL